MTDPQSVIQGDSAALAVCVIAVFVLLALVVWLDGRNDKE